MASPAWQGFLIKCPAAAARPGLCIAGTRVNPRTKIQSAIMGNEQGPGNESLYTMAFEIALLAIQIYYFAR